MNISFINRRTRGDKSKAYEYEILLKNINDIKKEIDCAKSSINFAVDPILLNQLIYQLKALEMRYRYWFKIAREMENNDE